MLICFDLADIQQHMLNETIKPAPGHKKWSKIWFWDIHIFGCTFRKKKKSLIGTPRGGAKYGLQVSKTQIDRVTLVFIQLSNVVYQNSCLIIYFKKKKKRKIGGVQNMQKKPKIQDLRSNYTFFFCFWAFFWKSGKNWSFDKFVKILTFSVFS